MLVRVAVVGAGAIGGVVAAALCESVDLFLCARSRTTSLAVNTPAGLLSCAPRVVTSLHDVTVADLVLVATKSYDSAAAAAWLPNLCQSGAPVVVLQNGVDHVERFSALAPGVRIIPAIVDMPCHREPSGRIVMRRAGSILLPPGDDAELFASLLTHPAISVSTTDDFVTAAWRKLCFNCAGAVAVVTLTSQGISRRPTAAAVIKALVRECVLVGRAEGAQLEDDLPDKVVAAFQAAPPEGVNSMLADRLAGRPLEYDLMNGVVAKKGRARGIPTPTNDTIVALLEALSPA